MSSVRDMMQFSTARGSGNVGYGEAGAPEYIGYNPSNPALDTQGMELITPTYLPVNLGGAGAPSYAPYPHEPSMNPILVIRWQGNSRSSPPDQHAPVSAVCSRLGIATPTAAPSYGDQPSSSSGKPNPKRGSTPTPIASPRHVYLV